MALVVFMGTPRFAVPVLLALNEEHQVAGVITQPDRPAGRGRNVVASPVKVTALELGLPVFQPKGLRSPEAVQHLAGWQPEVIVVAAFGQILRPAVLELAPYGCLNVHGSLLPAYRGAAPIPAAILAGDQVTGVTIMRLDEGLDTGPILSQAECPVAPTDTTALLTEKLAHLGARLLIETLPGWLNGTIEAQPQHESAATYCRPLNKDDGSLDWTRSAAYLDRQVRACNLWPGAFTTWRGQHLKVLSARPHIEWPGAGEPGQVIPLDAGIGVMTGQGALELVEVQLAGKKPMLAEQFARGQRDLMNSCLGSSCP
jgi:methionyl-tRNA formyltransferase